MSIIVKQINKKLEEAEKKTDELYTSLDLEKDFEQWFKGLSKEKKLEIYKMYELDILSYEEDSFN